METLKKTRSSRMLLIILVHDLSQLPGQLTAEEKALEAVVLECQEISEEFSSLISKLQASSTGKIWKSFQQAAKLYWSREKIG